MTAPLGEYEDGPRDERAYTRERQAARQDYLRGAALMAGAILRASTDRDIDEVVEAIGAAERVLGKATLELLKAHWKR